MKKLLLILLCLPLTYSLLIFTGCSSGAGSDNPDPNLKDILSGNRWRANTLTEGYYLSSDGKLYLTEKCQPDVEDGIWSLEDNTITHTSYDGPLEIITFIEIYSFTNTTLSITLTQSSGVQVNMVYTLVEEDIYGCTDVLADNYNPLATCDDDSCNFCINSECTYVPDNHFEAYLESNGMGNGVLYDNYVFTSAIDTVTNLNVYVKNISDLTGIENFTALTDLNCSNNQLTSLDVSGATALTGLNCSNNQLTTLNLSNNTALTSLHCRNNQLTTLNLSNNTALTSLHCRNNQLTTLNLSNNTALTYLGCGDYQGGNQLTSLDVSQNTALTILYCSKNQLTTLDVSNNTALVQLLCEYNQLTTLDVRNGNNTNIPWHAFTCISNPNLTCISVDNAAWSTANWTVANQNIDPQHYFSEQCP